MSVYFRDDAVTVHHGDCLEILPNLPVDSVDAVVCDPPYNLTFMGKDWDRHATPAVYQEWCLTWAHECQRILKPGGHMLAFGGSRTWHRLVCAIEDAGFEIRDSIAWLYGSGFPKSLDVSKAIDKAAGATREVVGSKLDLPGYHLSEPGKDNGVLGGGHGLHVDPDARLTASQVTAPATDAAAQWQGWGTALKPAFEPIVVARKPLAGTVAANVLAHGTGALNVDACRVGDEQRVNPPRLTNAGVAMGDGWRPDAQPTTAVGRWPANVVLDDTVADQLDKQSGNSTGGQSGTRRAGSEFGQSSGWNNHANRDTELTRYGDSGGASRFFPVFRYTAKAPTSERPTADGVAHPTVKPLELMRWLVRLVTPPAGVVLDPFAGSGTTGEAAIHEHKHAILIERDPEYVRLIVKRMSKPMAIGFDYG